MKIDPDKVGEWLIVVGMAGFISILVLCVAALFNLVLKMWGVI